MIKNYLKIAIRNIVKHSFFSLITILGMTAGISACLLIVLYIKDELGYDRFHEHSDRIYQVGLRGKIGPQDVRTANTCPPLAHAMASELPEVESATRIASYFGQAVVKVDEKAFIEERVFFADSNFFRFFSFRLLEGDPNSALTEPNSVVLTERMAKKYFPSTSSLGKTLTIGNDNKAYKVTGVAQNVPTDSHFHFDFLLSSVSADHLKSTVWLNNFLFTYVTVKQNASVANIEGKLVDMVGKYVGPEIEKYMGTSLKQMKEQGGDYGFYVTPLVDIHLHSTSQGDIEPGGDILYVYSFGIIAVFIMIIACINFMNMSTAQAAGRAKEVGLRKTLGSLRGQMIGQFLTESMIYSFLAVSLSLATTYLLLPVFNELAGKELGAGSLLDFNLMTGIAGIMAFVGLVAGSYPAFYLTSFNAVEVLKGKLRSGLRSQGVRSVLVVFQFSISIFLIISTIIVYNQLRYMQQKDLGFDRNQVIYLHNLDRLGTNKEAFRNAVAGRSDVQSVSFTNNSFPGINNTTVFKAASSEQDHIMGLFYADHEQMDVMKFRMVKGRFFSKDFPSDSLAIVLNESAAGEFGWKDPINEVILYKGGNDNQTEMRLKVIGVFKDFNFESLKERVRPLAMMLGKSANTLSIRYSGNPHGIVSGLETQWKQFATGEPFQYRFLDENYDGLFRAEQRLGRIFWAFSGLAIFIACLGLFALAAFTAEQRTKEIGIRKAMGATVTSLTLMISRDFTRLVIIAFALVVAPTWYAVKWWLEGFAFRTELNPLVFVLGGVLAILVAWLTVSYQSLKAASTNPVTSLRYE